MSSELNQRRILHRAAFLVELLFFPIDSGVGIGALLQQFLREFEWGQVACWWRWSMRRIADSCRSVRTRLAQPRQRVQGRSAWIGRIRIGAMIEQDCRKLEVRIH